MQHGNDSRRRFQRPFVAASATALALGALTAGTAGVASAATPGTAATATKAGALDPSQFQGVNWADPRDNYADDAVVPSGLSTADDYATTYAKARDILQGFKTKLRANTVRLPVNPYSVGTSWWESYRGAIDAATHLHMKVILSYWEGVAHKDGKVDDSAAWKAMWNTATSAYQSNDLVYYEPMNEPFGYSDTALRSLEASWIADHPGVPRDHVFVSGTGYNDHISTECADPALAGTYVSQHFYGFWHQGPSYAQWRDNLLSRIHGCEGRAVIDEFGAPMTAGFDYTASDTASTPDTNEYVAYMQATTDLIREWHMGSVYWPGLRNGDSYSLTTLIPRKNKLDLSVNSPSGLALIQWGWGHGEHAPHPAP